MLNRCLKLLTLLQISLIYSIILFCECAHKVRYHKAVSIGRKASPQLFFDFVGDSDGDIGDVFGFLSYYKPEDDIDLLFRGEDLRNASRENEDQTIDIEYDGSSDVPSTLPTPRNTNGVNGLKPTSTPKPLKVCTNCRGTSIP